MQEQEDKSKNRRIAKNTVFLYFRMILIMIVSLYTSRVILKELGIIDYGIYNVVGGIVTMFSFINASMSTSTQRFITFALGENNIDKLKKIFSVSLMVHICISVAIALLAETIGLWFLNAKLSIPDDRMYAANWVYQFSVFIFCANITQVPYNAELIAHERMGIFAYISIIEVVLKLLIVYLLCISPVDKLIAYAFLLLCVQLAIRTAYMLYCKKNFEECTFTYIKEWGLVKEMTSFAGWNAIGSIAWMFRGQGINMLLNMFFGPSINAAKGIATQVSNAIYSFVGNFQTALNPQITKDYAKKNVKEMEELVYNGTKYSYYLLLLLSLPICCNIDYILDLWLTEVPDYTSVFVLMTIIDGLVAIIFGTPFMTSISATGNIKNYQIIVNSCIMASLPISYIFLKLGYNVICVFVILIIISAISGMLRFYFCKRLIGFSVRNLINRVILPILSSTILTLFPTILTVYVLNDNNVLRFVITGAVSIISTLLSCWFIGLSHTEKQYVIEYIKKLQKHSHFNNTRINNRTNLASK